MRRAPKSTEWRRWETTLPRINTDEGVRWRRGLKRKRVARSFEASLVRSPHLSHHPIRCAVPLHLPRWVRACLRRASPAGCAPFLLPVCTRDGTWWKRRRNAAQERVTAREVVLRIASACALFQNYPMCCLYSRSHKRPLHE